MLTAAPGWRNARSRCCVSALSSGTSSPAPAHGIALFRDHAIVSGRQTGTYFYKLPFTHVKETLPAYCAPRELVLVDDLPRTALGKIKRPVGRPRSAHGAGS